MIGEAAYLDTATAPGTWSELGAGQIISYTLNDVIALRKDLTNETKELGNAVARCSSLDTATQDQWHAMRERVVAWLSDDPSWFRSDSQYRRGEAIRTDLKPWYSRLSQAGCSSPSVPTEPSKPLAGAGATLTTALMWGAVIVGGVLVLSIIDKTGLPRVFGKGSGK